MKIPNPYCASTRHAQSDPRISFTDDLKCRRSSSDKKFFGRTHRGNNKILSLESADIIKKSDSTVCFLRLLHDSSLSHTSACEASFKLKDACSLANPSYSPDLFFNFKTSYLLIFIIFTSSEKHCDWPSVRASEIYLDKKFIPVQPFWKSPIPCNKFFITIHAWPVDEVCFHEYTHCLSISARKKMFTC